MIINFTKMEGCGNDYVYIEGISQRIPQDIKPELVRKLSDRHFGIGGDGVIFINDSQIADFEMEMYNADGSRGEMCGNGIRCVGKFVYDYGLTNKTQITVESFKKIKYLTLYPEDGFVKRVRVNMGPAILEAAEIPVLYSEEEGSPLTLDDGSRISCAVVDAPLEIGEEVKRVTCVSMGNPHSVVFCNNVDKIDLEKIGPLFENSELFPERVNAEFVKVIDEHTIEMRVWERGSGETWACGTGACAVAVAAVENGLCKKNEPITVKLKGGNLVIEYTDDTVYLTGYAETVFEGEIEL